MPTAEIVSICSRSQIALISAARHLRECFPSSKARKKKYVILIDDISRIARDIRVHLDLRESINEIGAVLESPSLEFKNDPDSLFFENMQALNADYYRRKNASQTLNRMTARVMNGYWCFQSPIGYKHQTVRGHGRLLMRHEPLASIIQEGIEGFASGRFESQAELMRFWQSFPEFPKDRNGVVLNQRVKDILTRPIYAGMVEAPSWNIPMRKGQHEGLVSFETYQKVQERLNGKPKIAARGDINEDFPLRGAVLCGCGSPYTACWSKGKTKRYAYYLCHNRACDDYRKSIPRAKMEGEFAALLAELQPNQQLVAVTKVMLQDIWEYHKNAASSSAEAARKSLKQTEKKIEQFLDRIVESNTPSVIANYEKRISELENEKLLWQEKAAKTAVPQYSFEKMFELSMKFFSSQQKLWDSGKLDLQRLVLKLAFSEQLAYVKNQGFRTPEFSFPFKALAGTYGREKGMAHPEGFEPPTT